MTAGETSSSPSDRDRARLLALLVEHAFERREVTLASGQKSGFYIDCKQAALRGEGHFLIGRIFYGCLGTIEQRRGDAHAACAGMSMGADPLCSALSLTAYLAGRELPAIFVRKEQKDHGTGRWLEGAGAVGPKARVLLLEDVVTTGGSTLRACARLREAGYRVDDVIALVDRDAGGAQALQAEGLSLTALFSPANFGL